MPAFYAIHPAGCCQLCAGIAADGERIFPGRSYQGIREAANGRLSVWLKRNFYEYNKRNV